MIVQNTLCYYSRALHAVGSGAAGQLQCGCWYHVGAGSTGAAASHALGLIARFACGALDATAAAVFGIIEYVEALACGTWQRG